MLPELFQDLVHYIYVWLAKVLDIDLNVIEVDNDEDIPCLNQDFIDTSLEVSWSLR